MSLFRDVADALRTARVSHALIGAAAMAVHGVSRATADIDLLTVDAAALDERLWSPFRDRGLGIRIIRGDADDPLAGSVRLVDGAQVVDVVVGRAAWQREIVEAGPIARLGDAEVRVAGVAGLVLLKLYAGGPKDAWDIRSLLEVADDASAVRAAVEHALPRLDAASRQLWQRLKGEA